MVVTAILVTAIVSPSFKHYLIPKVQAQVENDKKNELGDLPIIKERAVIFLTVSEEDFERLVNKTPALEQGLVETVGDFILPAIKLEQRISDVGIRVIWGHWKKIRFADSDGKTETLSFNPEDGYAIALYSPGKPAKILTAFGPELDLMAGLISEYFGIKLERSGSPGRLSATTSTSGGNLSPNIETQAPSSSTTPPTRSTRPGS